jgi:hypothetical protein
MRPGGIRGLGRGKAVLGAEHDGWGKVGQMGIGGLGFGGFAQGRQGGSLAVCAGYRNR